MFELRELKSLLAYNGMTMKELAIKLDISEPSLYRKVNNPDLFNYKDMKRFSDIFGKETAKKFFFED